MLNHTFHIYEKSLSILTLYSGEIVKLDVEHLNNPSYLNDVRREAIASGYINRDDLVCEWGV